MLIVAEILFQVFHIFSFYANALGIILALFLMSLLRKDLIKGAFTGGAILTLLCFPAYWIPLFLFPSWVKSTWDFHNISGILAFGVPLEDLIWWFLIGSLIAILYDYWFLYTTQKPNYFSINYLRSYIMYKFKK